MNTSDCMITSKDVLKSNLSFGKGKFQVKLRQQVFFFEFVVGTAARVHDIVHGTAIDDELFAGRHGGPHTERSSKKHRSVVGLVQRLLPE